MMRILIALAATFVLAGAAAAAAPQTSWGKAGVSFDDYRSDATFCLRQAAATDLTGTEPANALVAASRRLATGESNDYTPSIGGANSNSPAIITGGFDPIIEAANRMQRERMAARPDLRIRQAHDILQRRLDHCLAGRGYRRFRLTADQRGRLRHFPERAAERQTYLYSLASDPQVLAAQGE
jgi:hypothetical protein